MCGRSGRLRLHRRGSRRSGRCSWESGWSSRDSVLRDRKRVAVGVDEPCDLGASRGGPDSIGALLEVRVVGELYTFAGHLGDDLMDVVDLRAEDGKGEGSKVFYANDADHGPVGVHDDGEGVVADEAQAENFFVEASRACRVFGGDEGYERAVSQHGVASLVGR